jgi:serine/threonine protein kinase/predicted Zn-dependent protease
MPFRCLHSVGGRTALHGRASGSTLEQLFDIHIREAAMVGRIISHYQILDKLGEGGMGMVYKARDSHLNRFVAIKVLRPDKVADADRRRRFIQEAKAASALNHPNIVHIYDIDQQDGVDYIAMEHIQGRTLDHLIGRKGLKLGEALKCAEQIADALSRAHAAGIIHRDLKPGNIMVDEHGLVKVLDFGLAKLTETTPAGEDEHTRSLGATTEKGNIVGTVAYMSPEQAEGKPLDARSDIFSLGSVLYEMVTGRRAFQKESKISTLAAILNQEPAPLSAEIPHDVEKIVKRCLRKDPAHRLQTMADLKVELEEVKEEAESRKLAPVEVPTQPRKRRVPWPAVVAAAIVVLTAAGLLVWQRMHIKPLTDKDVLVLADFTNTTGDSVFDGTLREALAVQLEQSPFLKTLGEEQVRQDLRLMGRSAEERITNQVALEICQREGEKGMISGSIASLGKTFAVTLLATNCRTGETLARAQVEAENKQHVLRAVGAAATTMRAKLGESLASIEKLAAPPEQVTTTSLEAFQAFALGQEQKYMGLSSAAIPFYQRATDLDPTFASAYMYLGFMYGNVDETGRDAEYQKKAFALVDRVSERERLTIAASYYEFATGELDKAAEAYQLLIRTYPREAPPHVLLGNVYMDSGDWEKAVAENLEAIQLRLGYEYAYENLISAYSDLDRFDEAKAVGENAFAQKMDFSGIHNALLQIAYLQRDQTEAEKHIQWLAGNALEHLSLLNQATNAAVVGQLRKRDELLRRGKEMARWRNLPETAARFQIQEALGEALAGNREAARNNVRSAILSNQSPADTLNAALTLALCGDDAGAKRAADETSKRYPVNTLWNAVFLPSIRAAVELNRGQPAKAIELLQSAGPYERAHASAVYLRGLAYLRARKGTEAAVEFQKILDRKGANWGMYYPLSYVGLARAEALSGDTIRARKAYQDFLALWKDADHDIPILREARQESARLFMQGVAANRPFCKWNHDEDLSQRSAETRGEGSTAVHASAGRGDASPAASPNSGTEASRLIP